MSFHIMMGTAIVKLARHCRGMGTLTIRHRHTHHRAPALPSPAHLGTPHPASQSRTLPKTRNLHQIAYIDCSAIIAQGIEAVRLFLSYINKAMSIHTMTKYSNDVMTKYSTKKSKQCAINRSGSHACF